MIKSTPVTNECEISNMYSKVKLYKQYLNYSDLSGCIGQYVFKAESKNYNILDVEMLFINYENIVIDKNYDTKQEYKILTRIEPLETKEIARLHLKNDWIFKFLYKITAIAPDKKTQLNFFQKDLLALEAEIKANSATLCKIPIDFLSAAQIEKILEEEKIKFIDMDFLPNYSSIINADYLEDFKSNFEYLIHWRRAADFALEFEESEKHNENNNNNNYSNNINNNKPNNVSEKIRNNKNKNNKNVNTNNDNEHQNSESKLRLFNLYEPEPNEIIPGVIPDNHFVSALSALAEKNDLIRKIIITKNYSRSGFYQVKLCFNGEWVTVSVDDFFPCKPNSDTLVSRSPASEIWVLVLEKALAKLYEAYYNLLQLNICDYFSIFTGLPTEFWDLKELLGIIDKQTLFKKIKRMLEKYNLMVAITKSDRNESDMSHNATDKSREIEGDGLLLPNMGYTLLKIENETKNHVIILRKIWYDEKKDEKIKKMEKENFENKIEDREKGLLYLTFDMFLKEFSHVAICHTQNWKETRLRGKFVLIKEIENQIEPQNATISRFYYEMQIHKRTKLFINLHQDDDIYKESDSRRQRMDLALTILKLENNSDETTHIESTDFLSQSSIQIEKTLEPGTYLILPRTTGCCCFGRDYTREPSGDTKVQLLDRQKASFTPVFVGVLKDVFRKLDVGMNKGLKFAELKAFWKTVLDEDLKEENFKNDLLPKYANGSDLLGEKGFINFVKDNLIKRGEDLIWIWMQNLGYDNDLYPMNSRNYVLSIHSDNALKIDAKDCLINDLNYQVNNMILKIFGKEAQNDNKDNKIVNSAIEYHSQDGTTISIGIFNRSENQTKITLSFAEDCGLIFSTGKNTLKKIVNPGHLEFFFHFTVTPHTKELKYTIFH